MEKLKTYLADKVKGDFARSIDVTPTYLGLITSGKKRPSFDLMVKIMQVTDGLVQPNDWVQNHEATH